MKNLNFLILISLFFLACDSDDQATLQDQEISEQPFFFPSNDLNEEWETESITSFGWNQQKLDDLYDFLEEKKSKSFLILVNGKIVVEEYMNGHTSESDWVWYSVSKGLLSVATGIAQDKGFLDINDKVSKYLGEGWADMPLEKENLIQIHHLLSFSSGITRNNSEIINFKPTYSADAGDEWNYSYLHFYLENVLKNAIGQDYEAFLKAELLDKIGIQGYWDKAGFPGSGEGSEIFNTFFSSSREMARFGLFALNKGKWMDEQIVSKNYFDQSIESSQTMNPSYGFFWWLNGKSKHKVPAFEATLIGKLVKEAPDDMFAAYGSNEQRIYVIPSQNMIIIRTGDSEYKNDLNFFDSELWSFLEEIFSF